MLIILINALNWIRIHKIDFKYGNHMFEGNIIIDKHSKSPHTSRKLWQSFRKTVKITFIGVFEMHILSRVARLFRFICMKHNLFY